MTAFLLTAWRWILSSRIAQGAAALIALIGWHMLRVGQARRSGRENERDEAREKAHEQQAKHAGDIHAARQANADRQVDRREREAGEDPRDRFGRDPWQ